jgi:hypothetical protein
MFRAFIAQRRIDMNTIMALRGSIFRERNFGILLFALVVIFTILPIIESTPRSLLASITFYFSMVFYVVRTGVQLAENSTHMITSRLFKAYLQKWPWVVGFAIIGFSQSVPLHHIQSKYPIHINGLIVVLIAILPLSALSVLLPLVIGTAVRLKIRRGWLVMSISFGLLVLRIVIWGYIAFINSFGNYHSERFNMAYGLADGGWSNMGNILFMLSIKPSFSYRILVFIVAGASILFYVAIFGAYISYKERKAD